MPPAPAGVAGVGPSAARNQEQVIIGPPPVERRSRADRLGATRSRRPWFTVQLASIPAIYEDQIVKPSILSSLKVVIPGDGSAGRCAQPSIRDRRCAGKALSGVAMKQAFEGRSIHPSKVAPEGSLPLARLHGWGRSRPKSSPLAESSPWS